MSGGRFAAAGLLAQAVNSVGGTPETILSGAGQGGLLIEVTLIYVANFSGSAVAFSLFHDPQGVGSPTFDKTTALMWDKVIAADDTLVINAEHVGGGIPLGKAGVLGFQSDVTDSVNMTVYGVTVAPQNMTLQEGTLNG